jgi:hypothetical protein
MVQGLAVGVFEVFGIDLVADACVGLRASDSSVPEGPGATIPYQ